MTYRDYITNLFVIVDDILNILAHKHKTNKPKFDDSELITFLIFAMTFRGGNYKQTLKEFEENYADMFPYLPKLPAIVKRAKKLSNLTKIIMLIARRLLLEHQQVFIAIVDTKPIPVCKNQRMNRCKKVSGRLYKGNNGNREWFGFKLGLITDNYGNPISFEIIPASRHDINYLKELDNTVIEILRDHTLIGDKAFNSKELKEKLKEKRIELEAIKKGKIHHKQKERQLYLRKVRKRIETTLSRLYYMGVENIRAVSLEGFIAKIGFFVLALQFRMFFNV